MIPLPLSQETAGATVGLALLGLAIRMWRHR